MRIEHVFNFDNTIEESFLDRLNPFSDRNAQWVFLGIPIPQWISKAYFDFNASVPFDLNIVGIPLGMLGIRAINDILKFLNRMRRNNKNLSESQEFREAFQFIRSIEKMKWTPTTDEEYKEVLRNISKSNELISKYVKSIIENDRLDANEKRLVIKDAQYLYTELERHSVAFLTMRGNK